MDVIESSVLTVASFTLTFAFPFLYFQHLIQLTHGLQLINALECLSAQNSRRTDDLRQANRTEEGERKPTSSLSNDFRIHA